MDQKTAAYIAGIIDGEGSIGVMKFKPKLASGEKSVGYLEYLKVANTDYRLVAWLKDKTGVGCIYAESRKKANHRQVYTWHVSSLRFYELLKQVYPYLVIKREQANLIFLFRETRQQRYRQGVPKAVLATRDWYYEEMKRLHTVVEHGPPIKARDQKMELSF